MISRVVAKRISMFKNLLTISGVIRHIITETAVNKYVVQKTRKLPLTDLNYVN